MECTTVQIDSAALQQGEKDGATEPVKDGEVVKISGELLILAVGNGQQAGGGVRLCPGAGEQKTVKIKKKEIKAARTSDHCH